MTENPFQSPDCVDDLIAVGSDLRRRARLSFRLTVLILLGPAAYNCWAFNHYALARLTHLHEINFTLLAIGAALILFLGFPVLEAISRVLRFIFGQRADRADWQDALYRSLNRTVYLAIPGAVLWVIWVIGFYEMRANFYTISWAVGVPAHLLAACWYVPLLYRWFRLAVS